MAGGVRARGKLPVSVHSGCPRRCCGPLLCPGSPRAGGVGWGFNQKGVGVGVSFHCWDLERCICLEKTWRHLQRPQELSFSGSLRGQGWGGIRGQVRWGGPSDPLPGHRWGT